MDNNMMDLLSGLMKNPETVSKLKNVIGNLSNESSEEPDYPQTSTTGSNDLSFINDLINSNEQTAQLMNKFKDAYNVYSSNNSPEINLLTALTPFLSSNRLQSAEKMKMILKIGKATSVFARKWGEFLWKEK